MSSQRDALEKILSDETLAGGGFRGGGVAGMRVLGWPPDGHGGVMLLRGRATGQ